LKGPVPRTPEGKPDLSGFWNAPPLYNSNILEEHAAGFGLQAGKSVVIDPSDGKIPYQPWALVQRDENRKTENAYLDNEGRCILSGMPRIMLFSFELKQAAHDIVLFFDYVHATRVIHMDRQTHVPEDVRLWLGDSIGRWEGDTLVVETRNLNGKSWFALGGDFMTEHGHVVERFSMPDANTLRWQATITDPKTFTRPWTMQWNQPYLRGTEQEILDDDCHEGNADLDNLKAVYDAARAAPKTAEARPAPVRRAPHAAAIAGGFTGRWLFDQQASGGRGGSGISFPTELDLIHVPGEIHFQGNTVRQDALEVVYKLDGSEVVIPQLTSGVAERATARLEGNRFTITAKRTFPSPAGEVVVDIQDVYRLDRDVLTVERSQRIAGILSTGKAVYNRMTP
jgi:hypothetical protein